MVHIFDWKLQSFDEGQEQDVVVARPDYIDHFWMTAKVPGDVHSTLIEKGIIEHPFFGHNDQKCRWVEDKVWWYRAEFHWDEQLEPGERMELTFEGLDTFATIYLNGVELAISDNMFVPVTLDVTRELVHGKNIVAVRFDPISKHVKNKEQSYWSGFSKERIWTRKAQMNFGWDWGPRLVTVGIWQPVRLEKRKIAKWDGVFARTVSISNEEAVVEVDLSATTFRERPQTYGGSSSGIPTHKLSARLVLSDDDTGVDATVTLEQGKGTVVLTVPNPKLWWTSDLGNPHLYQLSVDLFADDERIDSFQCSFGIRTVEVKQRSDDGANVFTFVLNGVEIFAKGADWIPVDSFIGAVPDSRYHHLVSLARDAGMNMLRVWGGGIYEKLVFYEACDREGILVWQDFMFACAMYPDFNKNFMGNVEREIVHVVKRLRNHACLAIWCGNNENDWIYESMKSSGTIHTPFYGEKIYHEMMPAILEQLDPTRLYWPSSPYGGNDHNSAEEGDRHNWQVWHGHVYPRKFGEPERIDYSVAGVSFKNFATCLSTFVSEFGMHAASNRYTLQRWIPEGQFFWGSDEFSYRNKDYHHQKGILLMEGYTGIPQDVDEYLNYSMLTQAEGLKYGIEHYRRRKFQSSGALFWQLNDCWPGTSWSVIDYHLLPKASYFYAKRFFAPILLSARLADDGLIEVWAVNDTRSTYDDVVHIEVLDYFGKTVWSEEHRVVVAENGRCRIANFTEAEVLQGADPCEVVFRLSSEEQVFDNLYYLRNQKDLQMPGARLLVTVDSHARTVSISTDKHARMVNVEVKQPHVKWSDNYFDLVAGETRVVQLSHLDGDDIDFSSLRVTAMNAPEAIVTFADK
ncbi:beta-mannosidase [Alicyclobacillus dauci]|uniref:Beta-mannosidase B n=1 Tax=Alicyclobacillus dauci TaxID=1475485 RepID=A0ABY6Z6C8_9BACL|nr:glycoside hydrolase family 2 protein [Alicyclobacillus dauci]WAH38167.1 glycoside hydrolase family 2 protein [Alicyclobacillus dauci]